MAAERDPDLIAREWSCRAKRRAREGGDMKEHAEKAGVKEKPSRGRPSRCIRRNWRRAPFGSPARRNEARDALKRRIFPVIWIESELRFPRHGGAARRAAHSRLPLRVARRSVRVKQTS